MNNTISILEEQILNVKEKCKHSEGRIKDYQKKIADEEKAFDMNFNTVKELEMLKEKLK